MRSRNPALRPPPRFNFTPLIDMVFTMLIFFMLTLQIEREMAAKVNLPKADQASEIEKLPPKSLLVFVTPDGSLVVNGRSRSVGDFEADILAYSSDDLPSELVLRGDGAVPYEVIQAVMRAASNVGISKVDIAASRESEDLR
ncbi:MAG: ExbD/TolR family protein [Candidatus Binatia bacterium]